MRGDLRPLAGERRQRAWKAARPCGGVPAERGEGRRGPQRRVAAGEGRGTARRGARTALPDRGSRHWAAGGRRAWAPPGAEEAGIRRSFFGFAPIFVCFIFRRGPRGASGCVTGRLSLLWRRVESGLGCSEPPIAGRIVPAAARRVARGARPGTAASGGVNKA